jgi:hypothetical protein
LPEFLQASSSDLPADVLAFHLNDVARKLRRDERHQYLPSAKEVEDRCRKVAELCDKIQSVLLSEDGSVRDGLGPGYLFAFANLDGEVCGATKVQAVANDLVRLKAWAFQAANLAAEQRKGVTPKRGNSKDQAFHDMLEYLGGVYFRVWQKIPARSVDPIEGTEGGPYFRFAKAVISYLLPEWVNENGDQGINGKLGAAIAAHAWPRLWEK